MKKLAITVSAALGLAAIEAAWRVGKASQRLKRILGVTALCLAFGALCSPAGAIGPIEGPPPYEICTVPGESAAEHAECLIQERAEFKCLLTFGFNRDWICDRFERGF